MYVSSRALQVSAAREVGMMATDLHLPSHSTTEEIVAAVRWMCDAKHLHGVMVQLPLPDHVDEALVLREIDEGKDVDGLAPANTGAMMTRTSIAATSCSTAARDGHHDTSDGVDMRGFRQCTPVGCAELLRQHDVHVKGKRVVVLGTTNTAGTPLGMQMRDLGALSVTLCSVPKSLGNDDDDTLERVKAISRDADILAVMIGHAELVTDEWVKPGAAVLDVGINTLDVPDPTTGRPFTVVGDVDFHSVSRVASFVSPVPGGAGPMTVSALLSNVLRATQRHCAASSTSPPLSSSSSSSLPQQSSSPS